MRAGAGGSGGISSQHPLQLLDPLLDRSQFRQDFQRWAVLHLFTHLFLVRLGRRSSPREAERPCQSALG